VSALTTPAILLRHHPYSDTSQILRFYTRDVGVVAMVGKGVRKVGGRRGGALSTFAEGHLAFYYRRSRELQTFKDFSADRARMGISRDPLKLAAASALGELVLQHAGEEPNPSLFLRLSRGLDDLERGPVPDVVGILLLHLWGLIGELGYAPGVEECIACGRSFSPQELGYFDFGGGGILCSACLEGQRGPRLGPGAREQLRGFLKGDPPEEILRPRANLRLTSDFITYHISGGTPLRSLEVLATLMPKDDA
jgi:DNA repair protein RecO (recombination protein O)